MRFLGAILACLGAASLTPCLADPPDSPATTASQPASPEAPKTASSAASATAPATSTPSQPAAQATKVSTAAPAADSGQARDIQEKHLLAEGYTPEMHNGTKVWCRREQELGSRLGSGHKTCGTVEELNFIEKETQERIETSQRDNTYPVGK
ncbi:MAG: hypothetical protein WA747_12150 [Steroidobacteraceae bacterium]